ncbi:MAG: phosphatase PAP2 family protein [Alphaproteobacteria bacterium]|nr:phosphatase PAP2 family protein [Alphaproteobacteria bacterium]
MIGGAPAADATPTRTEGAQVAPIVIGGDDPAPAQTQPAQTQPAQPQPAARLAAASSDDGPGGPPEIIGVRTAPGAGGPDLVIDLTRPADFLFWGTPDGRRVTLFAPGAPMRAGDSGADGLVAGWRCVEGPAPGCAVEVDLARPMTVSHLRLDRPETTGGAYRVRLALQPMAEAPYARAETGVAWRGGRDLPPLWPPGELASRAPVQTAEGPPVSRLEPTARQLAPAAQAATADPAAPRVDLAASAADVEAAVLSAGVDCAQEPDRCQDPAPWDADYLAGWYQVPWEMAKRPFDFSREALIVDAIALGGFGLLYLVDEDIREEARDNQSTTADDVFDAVEPLGRFYPLLAVGAGAWAAGEVIGERSLQRVGLNGFQTVLLTAIPVEGTKWLMGRSRPLKDEGNDDWFGSGNSFLSGHTAYAFAAASAVAHEFGHIAWVPWVSYGAAAMVGAQRIYDDKHWASDVLVSALVGWGIGQAVADLDAFAEDSPLDLGALREPGAQGLRVAVEF